jgi:hypothetical protein
LFHLGEGFCGKCLIRFEKTAFKFLQRKSQKWLVLGALTEQEAEFEETRRCLFNSYHTYIQTHAGYLIAIVIGGITLVVSWKDFIVSGYWHWWLIGIFVLLVILAGLGFLLMIIRTYYWTKYANLAMIMDKDAVAYYYKTLNLKNPTVYPKNSPHINMLHLTITHRLHELKKKNNWSPLRGVLWLSGNKDPDEIAIALQNKQK